VPQKEGSPLALATSGVTVAPDGRSLVATFPSLSARKLFEPKDGSEQPSVSVTWSPRRDQVAEFYSARARYAMGKATPPKPAITAVLDVTLLPADRDPLDLPVVLRYAEDATAKEIAFRLVDARITKTGVLALKEKNVEFVEDRWVVAKPGATFTSLVLNLGEFKSSKVVQIVLLHDKKPVGEPIKLEVERAKAPAPGG
jgi:hypothetical protein